MEAARAEEEKKHAVVEKDNGGWSNEEIAALTKAITRFPPGTTQRWKTIAEYVESRSQKDVIKKAQELAERRNKDVDERREENIAAAQAAKKGPKKVF